MSSAEKRSHDRDVAPELREQALALDARQALGRFYPPKERVEPEDEAMEVIEDPRVRFTEGEAMRAKILALFPELTDPEFMAESPDTRIESVVAASWDKALELLKAIGYMPADDVSDVQFADPEALAEGRVEPLVDEDRIPSLPSRQWVVDTFVQSLSPQQKIELLRMERPVFFFEPIVRVDHFLSQLSDRPVPVTQGKKKVHKVELRSRLNTESACLGAHKVLRLDLFVIPWNIPPLRRSAFP